MMAPLDAEEQLIVNLYERVGPAVVHITSRVTRMDFFFGPMPSEGTGSGLRLVLYTRSHLSSARVRASANVGVDLRARRRQGSA